MNRIAHVAVPVAYGLAGALLLGAAAATGSATALGACALLAVLLLALVADPPIGGGDPRLRTATRIVAAAAALALAAAAAIAGVAQGVDLEPRWQWIALAGGVAALILLAPLALLRRVELEAPVRRSERTALARGAAVGATLGGAMLLAGEVLPAAATAATLGFALIAALEGVALARPGGAGLRRLATPAEADAVDAAVATGPPEVIGHRRVVVRSTGGAEYLSLDVLVRRLPDPQRVAEIRGQLERSIKGALPELVVSVRVRAGELPPPGPEDPTRNAAEERTRVFDEEATQAGDERPTERLDLDETARLPAEPSSDAVLPSAPWQRG